MTRQVEITRRTPLFNDAGNVYRPGYARKMLYTYERARVKSRPFGLKEWDFYQMQMGEWILQMTIGHVSYATDVSAHLFSLKTGDKHSFSKLIPFKMRGLAMCENPDASHKTVAKTRDFQMVFDVSIKEQRLTLKTADGEVDIDVLLPVLQQDERMVIALPFEKDRQFYLNMKQHFYGVRGYARFGSLTVCAQQGDTALLDFGRGVWPYAHEWFWGCGSRIMGDERIGFNIGRGFGITTAATENMVFVDGRAHKLGEVFLDYDADNLLAPWHFFDDEGRLDMMMAPVFDNHTATKVLFVNNVCHQVFGDFSGTFSPPEGEKIIFHGLRAFCEHAVNHW